MPLLVVVGPETTKLTSLSGNQAFTFTSLTSISMHSTLNAEMQLLAYHSVTCVFWKFEVRECLGLKIGGGGTAFPCVLWH